MKSFIILRLSFILQYFRFTLIGINLGFCEEDINLYTNVVFDQISTWVKDIAKPFRERSICDTDKGLSKFEVTTHNWYRPRYARYADNDCNFQPWEKDCFCGDGHIQKGIVQIYQLETDGSVDHENYFDRLKLPYKLKIPLCLGTLITHYHVLTTKLCFGSLARLGENGFLERWKQTGCTLKQIIRPLQGSFRNDAPCVWKPF